MHVDVTQRLRVAEYRDFGTVIDKLLELTPPPWNDKVDVPVQRKIVLERLAVMDEGASVGRDLVLSQRFSQQTV